MNFHDDLSMIANMIRWNITSGIFKQIWKSPFMIEYSLFSHSWWKQSGRGVVSAGYWCHCRCWSALWNVRGKMWLWVGRWTASSPMNGEQPDEWSIADVPLSRQMNGQQPMCFWAGRVISFRTRALTHEAKEKWRKKRIKWSKERDRNESREYEDGRSTAKTKAGREKREDESSHESNNGGKYVFKTGYDDLFTSRHWTV